MEDFDLSPKECYMNLFDTYDDGIFLSDNKASIIQGKTLHQQQQSLSSECISKTQSNFSATSSTITENKRISPKLSASSSISSFQSQILSFENPNSYPTTQINWLNPNHQNEAFFSSVSLSQLGNTRFSTQNPKGYSKNRNLRTKPSQCNNNSKRSVSHAQDHIKAERKRREKLSQSIIALAALVPGLKKMDKASVLEDAIKYLKELKERLTVLEEHSKKVLVVNKTLNKQNLCGDDDYSSSSCGTESIIDASGDGRSSESLLHVEARVSGQEVLIRIHCQKQKNILVNVLTEIQSFHLFVLNSSVLPFGDSILDITIIAQMGEGYKLTLEELVRTIRMATMKFMS